MTTAAGRQGPSARSQRVLLALGVAALMVPFGVVAIRYLIAPGHVFLSDDLALIDLHTRDALHWQQSLGPFDRFGWNHPGPAYFYVLSILARIAGPGAQAMFAGAAIWNLAIALACVWLVAHRNGAAAAAWCTVSLIGLAAVMGATGTAATTTSESPLGALVSPWNPMVVIFPLVLFGLLCADGAQVRAVSLLGAALVGSFAVQTNLSTLPLVAVGLVAASVNRVVLWRRGRAVSPSPPSGKGGFPVLGMVASAVLVLVWLPPLVQQFTTHPGNLTRIWRFFTSPHAGHALGAGFWSVLAVDGVSVHGMSSVMGSSLGKGRPGDLVFLAALVALGWVGVTIGGRRGALLARALGWGSLLGAAAVAVSVTRIVGPVYGYLVVWEIAVPAIGLIGVGIAIFGNRVGFSDGTGPTSATWALPVRAMVYLACLMVLAGSLLTVETARAPALSRASDPTVAQAWRVISAHLQPSSRTIYLNAASRLSLRGIFTYFGVFNELQERGYHPRVSWFWGAEVGPTYISNGKEPLQILLYPARTPRRLIPGYLGNAGDVEVALVPGPPPAL